MNHNLHQNQTLYSEHFNQSRLFLDLLPDRAFPGVHLAKTGVCLAKMGVRAAGPYSYRFIPGSGSREFLQGPSSGKEMKMENTVMRNTTI